MDLYKLHQLCTSIFSLPFSPNVLLLRFIHSGYFSNSIVSCLKVCHGVLMQSPAECSVFLIFRCYNQHCKRLLFFEVEIMSPSSKKSSLNLHGLCPCWQTLLFLNPSSLLLPTPRVGTLGLSCVSLPAGLHCAQPPMASHQV